MLENDANSHSPAFKRSPNGGVSVVDPAPGRRLPEDRCGSAPDEEPAIAIDSTETRAGADTRAPDGLATELAAKLRRPDASREARQHAYILRYLYPGKLEGGTVGEDYPHPSLRSRIPAIAAAAGLSKRTTSHRLRTLKDEGLVEVGDDPMAKGRKVAQLTSEGKHLTAELTDHTSPGRAGASNDSRRSRE